MNDELVLLIKITPFGYLDTTVVIQWTFPIRQGSPFHKRLEKDLSAVHGVEYVALKRYSAEIEFAPFVVKLDEGLRNLHEALNGNAELQQLLADELNADGVRLHAEIEPRILR